MFLVLTSKLSAQQITVTDSLSGKPIANASVIIIDSNQATNRSQGITDTAGRYQITLPLSKVSYMYISAVGFKSLTTKYKSLDTLIKLVKDTKELREVVIKAQRPPFKFVGNRLEYDISVIPNVDYLTTAEVLDRLPFLQIEESQLKMMNESITILINGRPNPIYSTVEGLKSLPPQALDKVEITMVPTARGNGGKVLNITLKRDYFLGFNGSGDVSGGLLSGAGRASVTYWRKKYGYDVSGNYNQGKQDVITSANIYDRLNNRETISQSRRKTYSHSGSFFLSSFYNIDSLSTVDVQVTLNPSKSDRIEDGFTNLIEANKSVFGNNSYNSHNENFSTAFSINYTMKGKKDGNALYMLSSYNHSDPFLRNQFANTLSDGAQIKQVLNNNGSATEKTFEIILQRNSNKIFRFTLGSKLISRTNSNNYGLGGIEADSTVLFKMNQLVSSNYLDADFSIKKFTFHTALRLDYNRNNFRLPANFIQNELNFVPNLTLSYNAKQSDYYSLNYSRSLTRPGIYQYSPVRVVSNAYQKEGGNVNLNNEVASYIGLNYMGNHRFARLGVNLRYTNISGLLREINTVDNNNTVASTPVNVDIYHGYTLGFFADFQLLKKLRISHNSSGSYLYERFAGRSITQWSGYLNDRMYVQINNKSMAGMNMTAYSANLLPQGKEQSLAYLKFDVNYSRYFNFSKSLPASFTVSLTNPDRWNGYPSYTEISSPEFYFRENRLRKNGVVNISFRVSIRGKEYANRTFNKEKSIQNADLNSKE